MNDHDHALVAWGIDPARIGFHGVHSICTVGILSGRNAMETTSFTGISHLDLSVSDVDASATWYERVLDLRRLHRVDLPTRTMIVLFHEASGLVIGLNQHQGPRTDPSTSAGPAPTMWASQSTTARRSTPGRRASPT